MPSASSFSQPSHLKQQRSGSSSPQHSNANASTRHGPRNEFDKTLDIADLSRPLDGRPVTLISKIALRIPSIPRQQHSDIIPRRRFQIVNIIFRRLPLGHTKRHFSVADCVGRAGVIEEDSHQHDLQPSRPGAVRCHACRCCSVGDVVHLEMNFANVKS